MKHHRTDQNSDAWFALRNGMPTGSRASDMITSAGKASTSIDRYAAELAGDAYAGYSLNTFTGNAATQRGHDLEPDAADWYSFATDRDVEECGFFTDDLERYGASPDRTVGDDGLIEIKCQLGPNHIKTLLAYEKSGKHPASYYPQCQMQLMVAEREWLDMVLYHPDLPCSIIRIEPDAEFQKSLKLQINECIAQRDAMLETLRKIAA